jgi:chromosome segregation ATPase
MPTYDFVRLSPSGHRGFVRSNSFSDHRHRSRRHVYRSHDDCYGVPRAEYDNLVEQNRNLRNQSDALHQERDTLKGELHRAIQANKDFAEINVRVTGENQYLRDENARLRRSVSVDDRHCDGFKRRIKDLEREAKLKADEIRRIAREDTAAIHGLEDKVRHANHVARQWMDLVEGLRRRREYLEALVRRRDAQLEERDATIRRLQELLARYRGW